MELSMAPRESPNGGPKCTCPKNVGSAMRCRDHFMKGTKQRDCERCKVAGSRCHNYTCPQDHAHGTLCRAHFDADDVRRWEQESCPDCIAADQAQKDDIQKRHTIDPARPYGQHIPLTCKNHPDLRWHTKNIDFIGARSIFYSTRNEPECSCPVRDLIPITKEG